MATESVLSCVDEMLTAFVELQRVIHEFAVGLCITSLLSEIALCSSVSITTAAKVPIQAIPRRYWPCKATPYKRLADA